MPYKAIPDKLFKNREREFTYLRALTDPSGNGMGRHILLHGPIGIGKTEILRQFHRILFKEEGNVVPFYYPFQRSTLKTSLFAKDYFSRFVRQFFAFIEQDPSIAENLTVPLSRLVPRASGLGLDWFVDIMDDFQEQLSSSEGHEGVLAAITLPAAAAAGSGLSIMIMLDDFHVSEFLYESVPGDSPGIFSLFAEGMKTHQAPHVLATRGMFADTVFRDETLRGRVERLKLGPLNENDAFDLFRALCGGPGIEISDECRPLMGLLAGNPLYIRNTARAVRRMQKRNIEPNDFLDGYSYEVTEGDTASCWASAMEAVLKDPARRHGVIKFLGRSLDNPLQAGELGRLSRSYGLRETELRVALESLHASGVIEISGAIGPVQDQVLRDYVKGLHLREIQNKGVDAAQRAIKQGHSGISNLSYEMSIPMEANAELVAAKAVEQLGENMGMGPEVISQIQLALIEAVINAKEHSGSYDKKIRLGFRPSGERIEIVVESPGKAFSLNAGEETAGGGEGAGRKRGMGFRIMHEVMDEVRVERVNETSRVILIKNTPRR